MHKFAYGRQASILCKCQSKSSNNLHWSSKDTLLHLGKYYENKSFLIITNYHFVVLLISHNMHGITWLDIIFVHVTTALHYNTTDLCVRTVSHMQVKG